MKSNSPSLTRSKRKMLDVFLLHALDAAMADDLIDHIKDGLRHAIAGEFAVVADQGAMEFDAGMLIGPSLV